ncbi:MAG: MFS transporter [Actinobacteria bacterium]|nr:MFS transporter [Actinomycetota bacterium]MBV8597685.1 MFS transporter [Actinomycetota bacterium]
MTLDAKKRWYALAVICSAQFMVVLDVSIVNVALPSIKNSLHFSESGLQWVISAYTLVAGGFLLLGGRVADILGRRRMFVAGLALFTTGSLLCGLAWSHGALIAFRAVQGFGAAFVAPAALSLIYALFDEGADRNKALGVMGAISGSGAAFGVLLGGVLTSQLSWSWIFFVNVPVGAAAIAATIALIPESTANLGHRRFDVAGAATVTASLTALTYAIVKASDWGWGSSKTIGLLIASVVGLGLFVLIETRSKAPLMPLRIWLNRAVAGANIVGFMIGASIFAMFFILSLYMQQVLGYSALKAGVAYLACALTVVFAAGIAGRLVTVFGVRRMLATGVLVSGVGLYYFTHVSVHGTYWKDLFPGFIIAAVGLGFSFVPVTIAALSGVENRDAGLASGMINVTQQIGGALGTAIAISVATSRMHHLSAIGDDSKAAWTGGFQWAFWGCIAFSVVGVLATLVWIRRVEVPAAEPAIAYD